MIRVSNVFIIIIAVFVNFDFLFIGAPSLGQGSHEILPIHSALSLGQSIPPGIEYIVFILISTLKSQKNVVKFVNYYWRETWKEKNGTWQQTPLGE